MWWFFAAFVLLHALASATVFVLGDRDARLVAAALPAAFLATLVLRSTEAWRFARLSIGITIVDLVLLAVVVHAALRTKRTWIILTASFLIFPPLGHFAKLVDPALWPGGYWLTTNLPSLGCVALLTAEAWRLVRRRRRAVRT